MKKMSLKRLLSDIKYKKSEFFVTISQMRQNFLWQYFGNFSITYQIEKKTFFSQKHRQIRINKEIQNNGVCFLNRKLEKYLVYILTTDFAWKSVKFYCLGVFFNFPHQIFLFLTVHIGKFAYLAHPHTANYYFIILRPNIIRHDSLYLPPIQN